VLSLQLSLKPLRLTIILRISWGICSRDRRRLRRDRTASTYGLQAIRERPMIQRGFFSQAFGR
jgi:hypothetical protein